MPLLKHSYLEQMAAHVDEGGRLNHENAVELLADNRLLRQQTRLLLTIFEGVSIQLERFVRVAGELDLALDENRDD